MTQQHLVGHRSHILAHFVCQHTGHCCKSPGYVYVTSSDIDAMSKELQISTSQFIQHFVTRKNGWSLIATSDFRTNCFLDNKNKCTVYDGNITEAEVIVIYYSNKTNNTHRRRTYESIYMQKYMYI